MFQRLFALIVAFLLLVAASRAQASTILLAHLTNDQENPPAVPTLQGGAARPASFGDAFFELNDAMDALTFTATIFNIDFTGSQTSDLNDNLIAAHIHAGPAVTPTTNGPVVWGFFGLPFNDNNPNDVVLSPFVTGVGGTISGKWDAPEGNNTTLAAQLPNILNGQSYINFHTTQFGGGEARGAITAVPEPSTLTLLGLCVVGLLGGAHRHRNIRD
jgi:CHRD domain/PEP-CTERM motif